MTDHTPAYDLLREAFQAGQQFERDSQRAYENYIDAPAAHPYIAPLAHRLEQFIEEQVKDALANQQQGQGVREYVLSVLSSPERRSVEEIAAELNRIYSRSLPSAQERGV